MKTNIEEFVILRLNEEIKIMYIFAINLLILQNIGVYKLPEVDDVDDFLKTLNNIRIKEFIRLKPVTDISYILNIVNNYNDALYNSYVQWLKEQSHDNENYFSSRITDFFYIIKINIPLYKELFYLVEFITVLISWLAYNNLARLSIKIFKQIMDIFISIYNYPKNEYVSEMQQTPKFITNNDSVIDEYEKSIIPQRVQDKIIIKQQNRLIDFIRINEVNIEVPTENVDSNTAQYIDLKQKGQEAARDFSTSQENKEPENEGPENEGPENEGPRNEGPENEGPINEEHEEEEHKSAGSEDDDSELEEDIPEIKESAKVSPEIKAKPRRGNPTVKRNPKKEKKVQKIIDNLYLKYGIIENKKPEGENEIKNYNIVYNELVKNYKEEKKNHRIYKPYYDAAEDINKLLYEEPQQARLPETQPESQPGPQPEIKADGFKKGKGFERRFDFPPNVRRFIANYGDFPILHISACRRPLMKYIDYSLNVLSLGSWSKRKKQFNYDNLFHTFLVFKLANNETYLIEKNEVINVEKYKAHKNDKCIFVPFNNKRITIRELLTNAYKKYGQQLIEYDPISANCQKFVQAVLSSSSLLTHDAIMFINQDVDNVLSGYPLQISRMVTKFANRFDTLIHGKAFKQQILNDSESDSEYEYY